VSLAASVGAPSVEAASALVASPASARRLVLTSVDASAEEDEASRAEASLAPRVLDAPSGEPEAASLAISFVPTPVPEFVELQPITAAQIESAIHTSARRRSAPVSVAMKSLLAG
jgi:hypothetical protein